MKYVLGLDLGETSLGWSVIEKNDSGLCRFVDFGVRIFPDGREDKSKEPLAVARRVARGMRRRRDRYVMRRKALMNKLIEYGFMPADSRRSFKNDLSTASGSFSVEPSLVIK